MSGQTQFTQYQAEQRVAAALYQFGELFGQTQSENEEEDNLETRYVRLIESIEFLIQYPCFIALSAKFDLKTHELKIIALAYICAIEPDVISPFMRISWYEQGPSLSLGRVWNLCTQQAQTHESLINAVKTSNIFRWNMLMYDSAANLAIQPATLVSDIVSFISNAKQPELEQTIEYQNTGLTILELAPEINAAHPICYPSLFEKTSTAINILDQIFEEETIPLAQSMSKIANSSICVVIGDEPQDDLELYLIETLRITQLKYDKPYIFWPDGLNVLSSQPQCWRIVRNWKALTGNKLLLLPYTSKSQNSDDQASTNHSINSKEISVNQKIDELEIRTIKLKTPSLETLAKTWMELSERGINNLEEQEANLLATLYPLTASQIRTICQSVRWEDNLPLSLFNQLQIACIETSRENNPELARLTTPKARWDQMILPENTLDQLNELTLRVKYGIELREQTKRYSAGVHALFWGKPGTGKTMAAEAMAAELRLPLYKVNLANIASKWIGESEKHLAKLFDDAQRQNAVLLFDEADAIFSKRSEVQSSHDKNANMGVSFLLQRMETYTGLLLLSTNFKSNLDDAFLRRFHGVVEFPMPDEPARLRLWQTAWNGSIQLKQGISTHILAQEFEFSPAQIANIAERAILYTVAESQNTINKKLLAKAIQRELIKQSAGYLAEQKLKQWLNKN